ncbi:arsenate reductase/protein-tyrosine-phosphatase family protein [Phytohabitans rumicis]|uniref:Protein-tyrosine-phosphatase n=1 Tax=Phytohabitans rumicis TaxID=1076125 RepID=A0A6V8KSW7_9ACTN|nr:low molecular weight phosphatase family protein [Phytohabitans rumicis]GFJ88233.1 protein-tyrosine-phosphatase [Phytohabitans rumicis]
MLLFVCQGNLCRSPMAEFLARSTAGGTVVSAGTHAVAGRTMHPHAMSALAEEGIDASSFRSRTLDSSLAAAATLTLTATREQRAACTRLAPRQLGRVFTLRQFARLLDATGLRGLTDVDSVLAAVTAVRGNIQPVPTSHDEIADPVHGTLDDMRACMRLTRRSLRSVLAVVKLP